MISPEPGRADAHNHFHLGLERQKDCADSSLPALMLVNGAASRDWPLLESLTQAPLETSEIFPFYGLHPWSFSNQDQALDQLDQLMVFLRRGSGCGLGEIGLHRTDKAPPMELQQWVLRRQLEMAGDLGLPVSLHCVGAWREMADELHRTPPPRLMIHGFTGPLEFLRELQDLPAWFSIGPDLLKTGTSPERRILAVIERIPTHRLLLESDWEGKGKSQAPGSSQQWPIDLLARIAEKTSLLLGMEVHDLETLCFENCLDFIQK